MLRTPSFQLSLLEEHLEEVQMLWELRRTALRDPDYTIEEFTEVEERLEAHVDGLLIGGDHALPLLGEGLSQTDPIEVFSASYVLLRRESGRCADLVMDSFLSAEGETLEGVTHSLVHGPVDLVRDRLLTTAKDASPAIAAAAMEALTFHRDRSVTHDRLSEFFAHEDAGVRSAAWRITGMLEPDEIVAKRLKPPWRSPAKGAALEDDVPEIRDHALLAAIWTVQPWVLDYCDSIAQNASPEDLDALLLYGILGQPSYLQRILTLGEATELGPDRFRVIGAYGHPATVDALLARMSDADAATAFAAGEAFTRITGIDVDSDRREKLEPEDSSESFETEEEFLEEVALPDAQLAESHWNAVKDQLSQAVRCCRGRVLGDIVNEQMLAGLDMQSRWEACLRGKYYGNWHGNSIDLEIYPLPKGTSPPSAAAARTPDSRRPRA